MREQAPSGGLGGNALSASWHGFSVAEIYDRVITKKEPLEFDFGAVVNDPSNERIVDGWSREANSLLFMYGFNPGDWTERIIYMGTQDQPDSRIGKAVATKLAGNKMLIPFALMAAREALPVENVNEGQADTEVIVDLNGGVGVGVRTQSNFWKDEAYIHNVSGEILKPEELSQLHGLAGKGYDLTKYYTRSQAVIGIQHHLKIALLDTSKLDQIPE